MSDGHEPDRARWSYVLDGVALLGAMALGFGGTVLTLYTQNALWAVAGVIPAFALIGLAAFLRIIAKPRPWRGMRLQLLVYNIIAGAAFLAILTLAGLLLNSFLAPG